MNGRIIKAYMVLRGISQKELAERIGIVVSTLNFKINGKVPFNRDEMELISRVLNAPIEELFFTDVISKMKINTKGDDKEK